MSSDTAMQTALFAFGGRVTPLHPRDTGRAEDPSTSAVIDALALWEEYRWVAVSVLLLLLLYVLLGDEANGPAAADEKECPATTPPMKTTSSVGSTAQVGASADGARPPVAGAPSTE
jgi:hypothetical protein